MRDEKVEAKARYDKKYYAENKEKVAARSKKYRAENKEKIAAHTKEYYAENREASAATGKKYRAENGEKIAARKKEDYEKNKEKIVARVKKYQEKNKEKIAARKKEYYVANKDKFRIRAYFYKYGLTEEGYYALLESQDNACAVCKTPFVDCKLNVDHDHNTGSVRGLLCSGCNASMGMLKDSADAVSAAATYLESHAATSEQSA
jgi:hypothetical protein